MAIGSLVLGIVSLVLIFLWWWPIALFPVVSAIGTFVGLVAIVLGAMGRKNLKAANQPTGSATAGFVMGIIGTVINLVLVVACMSVFKMVGDAASGKLDKELEKALKDPKLQEELKKELEKDSK